MQAATPNEVGFVDGAIGSLARWVIPEIKCSEERGNAQVGGSSWQGFSVFKEAKGKSPRFGKMELSKTQIPKEVTHEAYHVDG